MQDPSAEEYLEEVNKSLRKTYAEDGSLKYTAFVYALEVSKSL
jgi:hypothetical protein